MKIWVDADACPVVIKEILYRAAERTGVQVLMLRHPGRAGTETGPMRIPTASEVLETGDTLVVAGTEEALALLENL